MYSMFHVNIRIAVTCLSIMDVLCHTIVSDNLFGCDMLCVSLGGNVDTVVKRLRLIFVSIIGPAYRAVHNESLRSHVCVHRLQITIVCVGYVV